MDANDLESGSDGVTPPAPQGAVSQQNDKQTSKVASETVEQRIARLEKSFQTIQGEKDKGVKGLKKEFETYKPLLEAIRGFVPAEQMPQVERELEYQDLKRKVYGTTQQEQIEPSLSGTQSGIDAEGLALRMVEKLGLDLNDPQVADAVRNSKGVDLLLSLADVAGKKAKAPQPTPATSAAISSGSAPASMTEEEKASKASRLQSLYMNPTVNQKEISAIEKELGWS